MLASLTDPSALSLMMAAVTVALFHTFVGIDHYLPFAVMGRARNWPLPKVVAITVACGIGHVIGSIALGAIGVGIGTALGTMEAIESVRGELASWGLILFGLGYMAYGVYAARKHTHGDVQNLTFWSLFVVFALGPCEPLIPVLMVPAFDQNWLLVAAVALLFSVATIVTMTTMAVIGALGLSFVPDHAAAKYGHIGAGLAIAGSGLAIKLFGI